MNDWPSRAPPGFDFLLAKSGRGIANGPSTSDCIVTIALILRDVWALCRSLPLLLLRRCSSERGLAVAMMDLRRSGCFYDRRCKLFTSSKAPVIGAPCVLLSDSRFVPSVLSPLKAENIPEKVEGKFQIDASRPLSPRLKGLPKLSCRFFLSFFLWVCFGSTPAAHAS